MTAAIRAGGAEIIHEKYRKEKQKIQNVSYIQVKT